MHGCIYRTNDNECDRFSDRNKGILSFCDIYNCEFKKRSNADAIRRWSDEEIAEFTIGVIDGVFTSLTGEKMPERKRKILKAQWLDWLSQEATDG